MIPGIDNSRENNRDDVRIEIDNGFQIAAPINRQVAGRITGRNRRANQKCSGMIRILKKIKHAKTTVTDINVNLRQNDCLADSTSPTKAAARPTGVT